MRAVWKDFMNLSGRLKYFGFGVFGMAGFFGGILAGVLGHPVVASILIAGTALIVFGVAVFYL